MIHTRIQWEGPEVIDYVELGEPSEHQQDQGRKEHVLANYVRRNHAPNH